MAEVAECMSLILRTGVTAQVKINNFKADSFSSFALPKQFLIFSLPDRILDLIGEVFHWSVCTNKDVFKDIVAIRMSWRRLCV